MRVSQYIVIAAVAVLFFSCDKTMDKSEESSPPVGKTDKDIISAVQYAYSLEEELWEHEQSIEEKEDVVTLFRKGFSVELARKYADYIWIEERGKKGTRYRLLRATDPVLILPETITVLSVGDDRATAVLKYEEDTEGPLIWEAHTSTVTLRLEPDGWKIYDIKTKED